MFEICIFSELGCSGNLGEVATLRQQNLGCSPVQCSVDKAPCLSNDIWILSSDTICQLNQLFSNCEAAMLSSAVENVAIFSLIGHVDKIYAINAFP